MLKLMKIGHNFRKYSALKIGASVPNKTSVVCTLDLIFLKNAFFKTGFN